MDILEFTSPANIFNVKERCFIPWRFMNMEFIKDQAQQWHKVDVDNIKFNFVDIFHYLTMDLQHWFSENIEHRFSYVRVSGQHLATFIFEDVDEAMMFKLSWC